MTEYVRLYILIKKTVSGCRVLRRIVIELCLTEGQTSHEKQQYC